MLERGALDAALLYDMGLARPVRLEAVTAFVPLRPCCPRATFWRSPARNACRWPGTRSPSSSSTCRTAEYFPLAVPPGGVAPRIAHATLDRNGALARPMAWASPCSPRARCATGVMTAKRLVCRRLRGPLAAQSVVMAYPERLGAANPRAALFARVVRECFTQQRDAMTAPEAP